MSFVRPIVSTLADVVSLTAVRRCLPCSCVILDKAKGRLADVAAAADTVTEEEDGEAAKGEAEEEAGKGEAEEKRGGGAEEEGEGPEEEGEGPEEEEEEEGNRRQRLTCEGMECRAGCGTGKGCRPRPCRTAPACRGCCKGCLVSVAGKGTRAAAVAKDGTLVSEEDGTMSGDEEEEEGAGPADWWLSWFACNIKSYSIETEDPGNSMVETWVMKESDH